MSPLLKRHAMILEASLKDALPEHIKEESTPDFESIKYLFQNNYLSGYDSSQFKENSYMSLKITELGKIYLSRIKAHINQQRKIMVFINSIPNAVKITIGLLLAIPTSLWAIFQIYEKFVH